MSSKPALPHRSLPVPFFQVLREEHTALHGADPARGWDESWDAALSQVANWRFTPAQLTHPRRSRPIFAAALARLERVTRSPGVKPPEPAPAASISADHALVEVLNVLLERGPALWRHLGRLRETITRELRKLTELPLDENEQRVVNRLLLEAVFPEEVERIFDRKLRDTYAVIHNASATSALCLSGGGIRSATFALGILQGLARRRVLGEFHYLSTVSGGGYIGGWLSSWIHHAGGPDKVFSELASSPADHCRSGGDEIRSRENLRSPLQPEPPPLRHLRAFSNYLTPQLGAFSADTWTVFGTYLRNLSLNWLVFIPILVALLAIPRVALAVMRLAPGAAGVAAVAAAGFAALVWGLAFTILQRPSSREEETPDPTRSDIWELRRGQGSFLRWCLAPMSVAALCFTTAWTWLQINPVETSTSGWGRSLIWILCGTDGCSPPELWRFVLLGIMLHLLGWLVAEGLIARGWSLWQWRHARELMVVLASGALGGILLWVAARTDFGFPITPWALALHTCLAAPVFLFVFLSAATLFIGVSSSWTSDDDREWWARMGSWVLIAMAVWTVFSALVLIGPWALFSYPSALFKTGVVTLGGAAGVVTLLMGASSATDAKGQGQKWLNWKSLLLTLAAPAAVAYVLALLAVLTNIFLIAIGALLGLEGLDLRPLAEHFDLLFRTPVDLTLTLLLAALASALLLSAMIDVNKFSVHAIYRNRLVRAYLGASNPDRRPNPFTGFDPRDNLRLEDLRDPHSPREARQPQRPLHVVNMALNLASGDNLAWQQRKAETFSASTLYCGNFRLGYRPSEHYARSRRAQRGLSLGTAIAISGAAASPNQGYHSSPVVALLMTLFNVRLGWWLGNPGAAGHATYQRPAPAAPVWHMIKEGLGITTGASPYVYLSDGGHFENLGLYEMVLRRCRVIVVSDAACDPACTLEDLGNAIRKIRIDLGVHIDLQEFKIFSRDDTANVANGKYGAVGVIDYTAVDGPGARNGLLIFFKATLGPDLPRDVFNYQAEHKTFPHETTGDQWFSESQFESYRRLGLHAIERLAGQAECEPPVGEPKAGSPTSARVRQFIADAAGHAGARLPDGWEKLLDARP